MNNPDSIKELGASGDPLEREIVKSREDLNLVLQPYAEIWENHIVPRRKSGGSKVNDDWMNFAGSHYTALIRVYHAYRVFKEYERLVEDNEEDNNSGRFLLEFHRVWASFWEHLGSAIDNLGTAFDDAKPIKISQKGCDYIRDKYTCLEFVYDRRSLCIHSRINPTKTEDGIICVRSRKSDPQGGNNVSKNVDWSRDFDADILVNELSQEWRKFLHAISNAWWNLREELVKADSDRSPCNTVNPIISPGASEEHVRHSSIRPNRKTMDSAEEEAVDSPNVTPSGT